MKKLFYLILFIPLISFSNSEVKLNSNIDIISEIQDCYGATAYRYEPNGRIAESISIRICKIGKTINGVYYNGTSVNYVSEGGGKYRFSTNKGTFYFNA